MAYTGRFGQSDDFRRDELIRIIEHSVEKLTLAELEANKNMKNPQSTFRLRISFFSHQLFLNLSPTKPCPISPAMRSKCWNTGGVGDRS